MLNALPASIHNWAFTQGLLGFAQHYFPFFNNGFGWLSFGIAGMLLGLTCHFFNHQKAVNSSLEKNQ